jgi:hypothetical protein
MDREITPDKKLRVLVDGQPLYIDQPALPLLAVFVKGADGKWSQPAERWLAGKAVKRNGLSGPMREITHAGSVIVYGTGAGENNWVLRHKAERIAREQNGVQYVGNERSGARFVVKSDAEVTEEDLTSNNLWLIGGVRENRVAARLAKDLPVGLEADAITLGDRRFAGGDYAVNFIAPSPLNRARYVYVNAGLTPRSYNHTASNEHAYDYCVNLNDGLDNQPVLKGVLDTDWQFQKDLVIYDRAAPLPATRAKNSEDEP